MPEAQIPVKRAIKEEIKRKKRLLNLDSRVKNSYAIIEVGMNTFPDDNFSAIKIFVISSVAANKKPTTPHKNCVNRILIKSGLKCSSLNHK
jgi:hypothetical protein